MAVTWDLYVDPFSATYTFDGDLGIYLRGSGMCVASADAKTNVGGGKWYFEIEYFSNSAWFASDPFLGLANPDNTLYTYNALGNGEDELGFHVPDGFYRYDYGTYVAYPSGGGISVSQGDILMIAIDLDDAGGKLWFGFNGVWLDGGNPATGANAARTDLKSIGFKWAPAITAGGTTEYKLYAQAGNVNYTIPAGFESWDPATSTTTYILAPVGVQVETTIDTACTRSVSAVGRHLLGPQSLQYELMEAERGLLQSGHYMGVRFYQLCRWCSWQKNWP